jgi:hypothetical protein
MTLRYQVDSGPEDDFLAASTPVVICSYTSGTSATATQSVCERGAALRKIGPRWYRSS